MRTYKLFIAILTLFFFSIATAHATTLYVDPSSIIDSSKTVGQTFTIQVKVADVTNLAGFDFKLGYNTAILDLFRMDVTPPWSQYFIVRNQTDETNGVYWCAVSYGVSIPPYTGSTSLVTLTFKVTGTGTSNLDLYSTQLVNSTSGNIVHTVNDGYFDNVQTTTIPPNSCTDSDGGINYRKKGTVSGYLNTVPYSYSDACTNAYVLREYYCSGTSKSDQTYDCRNLGSYFFCLYGSCATRGGGGCPTLFVYDGKEYKKEKISNIHSQEGIDTIDEIELTVKPVVIDGQYQLKLKEMFFPGQSHIDDIRLLVDGKEVKLISAVHSKYGDVTSILAESDDVRTNTKLWDEVELRFETLPGKSFVFEIEGYNPGERSQKIPYEIGPGETGLIVVIAAIIIIAVIFIILKLNLSKVIPKLSAKKHKK